MEGSLIMQQRHSLLTVLLRAILRPAIIAILQCIYDVKGGVAGFEKEKKNEGGEPSKHDGRKICKSF